MAIVAAMATVTTACGTGAPGASGRIVAIGAESQYANVISQIGGRWVAVSAVMDNPNTDPHTFESSAKLAERVASARLVVQNGLGYDAFMQTIERAAPSSRRMVVVAQHVMGLPDDTPNPHLWYDTSVMRAVATAVAGDLAAIDPAHAADFRANLARFDRSLGAVTAAVDELAARFRGAPVATTEPVADYLLQAAGLSNRTPWSFQADVMNGVDPTAQDVALQQRLLSRRTVRVLVYNHQVTDTLTQSLLALARAHHVPVVGVYETMPAPGFDYQRWMLAEVHALQRALADGVSAPSL
jgi:zinc/manganese transport system substrate-binding protein